MSWSLVNPFQPVVAPLHSTRCGVGRFLQLWALMVTLLDNFKPDSVDLSEPGSLVQDKNGEVTVDFVATQVRSCTADCFVLFAVDSVRKAAMSAPVPRFPGLIG